MLTLKELEQEEISTMSKTEVLNFTVIGKGTIEDEAPFMTIIATEPVDNTVYDTWESIEQAIMNLDTY